MPRISQDDFHNLRDEAAKRPTIFAEDMENRDDRTLLVGYTKERSRMHIYMMDEKIHVHFNHGNMTPDTDLSFSDGIPASYASYCARIYPEQCDQEFLMALHKCDPVDFSKLPFKDYDLSVQEAKFYYSLSIEHELANALKNDEPAPGI